MLCPHCHGSGRLDRAILTTRAAAERLLATGPVTVAMLATAAEVSTSRARRVLQRLEADGAAVRVDMPATTGRPPTGWRQP